MQNFTWALAIVLSLALYVRHNILEIIIYAYNLYLWSPLGRVPVHVFLGVFFLFLSFFVCLICARACVCVCVCVFGGLQNPLLSHSRKDVSQRRSG